MSCQQGICFVVIKPMLPKLQKCFRCCLAIDAMAIRKHLDYDSHKQEFIGYTDLGNGQDSTTEAKEALVIMMVGVTAGWKAPVAYYLTAGLTAESQKVLVSHLLSKLAELNFEVTAITMDGHPTNVAMASLLGAKLEIRLNATQPFFMLDGRKVYIIFDLCHMIKLLRNTLQAYSTFTGPQGDISWHHLVALHNEQQSAGLRLGNKLSAKHINFEQQKMKVSLAVQTFSSSSAKALRTMAAVGHHDFQDCLATADFIEVC